MEPRQFPHRIFWSFADAITAVQSDKCTQADAYYLLADLKKLLEFKADDAPLCFVSEVTDVQLEMEKRYQFGYTPAMSLAALLHPRYRANMGDMPMEERLAAEST